MFDSVCLPFRPLVDRMLFAGSKINHDTHPRRKESNTLSRDGKTAGHREEAAEHSTSHLPILGDIGRQERADVSVFRKVFVVGAQPSFRANTEDSRFKIRQEDSGPHQNEINAHQTTRHLQSQLRVRQTAVPLRGQKDGRIDLLKAVPVDFFF